MGTMSSFTKVSSTTEETGTRILDTVFSELQNEVLEMRSTLSHGAPGIFDDLYFIAKAQDFMLFKEVSFNLIIFMQRFFPKYKSGFLLLQTLPFLLTAFKWKSEFCKIIRTIFHGLASTNSFIIVYLVVIGTPKIQNYLQMKKVKHTFPHTLLHSAHFVWLSPLQTQFSIMSSPPLSQCPSLD